MPVTDAKLLSEIKRGSLKSFERLLSRYEKLIYHIAYRYFNNPQDAQDITQESVIKIYRGLPGVALKEGGVLKGWICAVTVNTCVDGLRKRRAEADILPEEARPEVCAAPSAEEEACARERADEIITAVASLPDDYRSVIILRDMQGLSYKQLAEAAGVGVNTVKSRLSRARAALISKLT